MNTPIRRTHVVPPPLPVRFCPCCEQPERRATKSTSYPACLCHLTPTCPKGCQHCVTHCQCEGAKKKRGRPKGSKKQTV